MDTEMVERRKLEQMQRLYNDVLSERDAAIQRAEAAEREAERYKTALQQIAQMGRVCALYEVCGHPMCSDSAGARLTALAALDGSGGQKDSYES